MQTTKNTPEKMNKKKEKRYEYEDLIRLKKFNKPKHTDKKRQQ
jgi:hypothetical protein